MTRVGELLHGVLNGIVQPLLAQILLDACADGVGALEGVESLVETLLFNASSRSVLALTCTRSDLTCSSIDQCDLNANCTTTSKSKLIETL